jgi:hypothetical protein
MLPVLAAAKCNFLQGGDLYFFQIFLESRKVGRLENRDRTFGFTGLRSVPDGRIKRPNRRYRSRLIVL